MIKRQKERVKKNECKRHRWRVGAGAVTEIFDKDLSPTYLNLWCEKCGKFMKAYYYSKYELDNLIKGFKAKGSKI